MYCITEATTSYTIVLYQQNMMHVPVVFLYYIKVRKQVYAYNTSKKSYDKLNTITQTSYVLWSFFINSFGQLLSFTMSVGKQQCIKQ